MYRDTIAAVSTPLGEGGIGIVRISGPEAREIAARIFDRRVRAGRLAHGHVVDPVSGEKVDEVLVSCMQAPHSYTREDVVEINCHGGALALQRTLVLVLAAGARSASPGEFTLRAFLNGRIDLAQAEAVLDIIRARSEAGLRLAMRGLDGSLSGAVRSVRAPLMEVLAYLIARIDFPDDDIEDAHLGPLLAGAAKALDSLIANSEQGAIYRQGVYTAIVGRPNVGKSSLLNRLLGRDRSIVTDIPGTTRDTIEEVITLDGVPFVLVDTAGLAHSADLVESLGIERSRRAIRAADLVLVVVDGSEPLAEGDREILDAVAGHPALVVLNKSDLGQAERAPLDRESICVSALTGAGLPELEAMMVRVALGGTVAASDALLVSNPRHRDALTRARESVRQAAAGLEAGTPEDLVAIDVTAALTALGEITGETVHDQLLETIFSNFCIGK